MAIDKSIRQYQQLVKPGTGRPGYAGEDITWSSKDDPELHQKMNEAVNQARTEYLQKIQSGEISMPDDL